MRHCVECLLLFSHKQLNKIAQRLYIQNEGLNEI